MPVVVFHVLLQVLSDVPSTFNFNTFSKKKLRRESSTTTSHVTHIPARVAFVLASVCVCVCVCNMLEYGSPHALYLGSFAIVCGI